MTSRPHHRLSNGNAGFSLVELMVGMVIALIASLAIVQVFSTFEDQKRSTTAGSEAQENGLIALSELEQGIHNAGAGLINAATFDCSSTYTYFDTGGGGWRSQSSIFLGAAFHCRWRHYRIGHDYGKNRQ